VAIPWTKYFCPTKKRMRQGSAIIMAAAMSKWSWGRDTSQFLLWDFKVNRRAKTFCATGDNLGEAFSLGNGSGHSQAHGLWPTPTR
jgi:hypothetical protein